MVQTTVASALNCACANHLSLCQTPLYGCEQWRLTETSLGQLDSLVGELCKRVLRLPKWFCNTPARIVMGMPSMRAHCLVRKLCFLRKLTDGDAECASLLGAKMLEAFGCDQKSTWLVRECLELEEWYGLGFTEVLCSEDADRPGARGIRDAVHECDREKLLDECEGRSDAVVVVRIEREIGWCKLWDCGRDRGPKCIAGLRALVRILTYPAHAMNCCPKCDVDRLGEGMTLLAHVIEKHTSARFTSAQLLNSLFEDNSSDFDLFLTRIHCLCLIFC